MTPEEAKVKLNEIEVHAQELRKFLETISNKQQEAEEWFLGILKGLNIGIIAKTFVEYQNSKGECMIQDFKNGEFLFQYDRIWLVLKKKFGMNNSDIHTFLTNQMLTHLGMNVTTTKLLQESYQEQMLTHLGMNVTTTMWQYAGTDSKDVDPPQLQGDKS